MTEIFIDIENTVIDDLGNCRWLNEQSGRIMSYVQQVVDLVTTRGNNEDVKVSLFTWGWRTKEEVRDYIVKWIFDSLEIPPQYRGRVWTKDDSIECAYPGGFTNPHEPIEHCSCRELHEETGLILYPNQVHQLKVYIPEDPRESVPGHWAYDVGVYARGTFGPVQGADDAAEAAWFPLSVARRTRLAFHHNRILEDYVKTIGG